MPAFLPFLSRKFIVRRGRSETVEFSTAFERVRFPRRRSFSVLFILGSERIRRIRRRVFFFFFFCYSPATAFIVLSERYKRRDPVPARDDCLLEKQSDRHERITSRSRVYYVTGTAKMLGQHYRLFWIFTPHGFRRCFANVQTTRVRSHRTRIPIYARNFKL